MGVFNVVDFKETAKEIFDICTNIAKADGRATEKVEEILKQLYEDGMLKGVNAWLSGESLSNNNSKSVNV